MHTTNAMLKREILLKGVFASGRCISAASIHLEPHRAYKIILATVVLHNLGMEHNVSIPEDRVINDDQLCNDSIYNGHQTDGSVVRTQLIESIS